METIRSMAAKLYIAYMCIVFGLFYHNNYIDIMQAKRAFFLLGGVAYVGVALVCRLIDYVPKMRAQGVCGNKSTNNRSSNGIGLLFIWLLLGSWLISFLISLDKYQAFWGTGAKCTGLFVYLIGLISAYFLYRDVEWTPILTWIFLGTTTIICSLQILNRWGIDPLDMYGNLVKEEQGIFISTIGQVNYNAVFDGLAVAVLMSLFMICKERFSQIVYGIVLVITFCGAICCCSDSFYLALIVELFALLLFARRNPDKWGRLATILVLLDTSLFAVWFCWSYVANVKFWGISGFLFNMKLHWALTGFLWLFILSGYLIKKIRPNWWKHFCILLLGLAPLTGIAAWKFAIEKWQVSAEMGWANSRLLIWGKAWRSFSQSSLPHKLWGYGFNNVNQALALYGENKFGEELLLDAHNIFINSFITSGVIGTLLMIAVLIMLLTRLIGKIRAKDVALVGCLVIVSYLAQGILNGPQILTEPVYLVAFGVVASILREEK